MTDESDGPCPVHGEVWSIDDARIETLDRFEGCPELYRRVRLEVLVDDAELAVDTYVYAGDPDDGEPITDGRWLR